MRYHSAGGGVMIGEYVFFCVCGGLYMDSWPVIAAIYVKKKT